MGTVQDAENSFELFRNNEFKKLGPLASVELGGRSVSAEEGIVGMTLLQLANPQSRSASRSTNGGGGGGGGGRVNSSAWPDLLAVGGEELVGGGRRDGGTRGVAGGSSGSGSRSSVRSASSRSSAVSMVDPKDMEMAMQELESSMPTVPPFHEPSGFRSSDSRSSSRKARLTAPRNGGISDSSSLQALLGSSYKSSSGSGSSGSGGGGPGERVGGGASPNDGGAGGGKISSGNGGGGASWERPRYPIPSTAGPGGATTSHDDRVTSNKVNDDVQSFREQSFEPDRPIAGFASVVTGNDVSLTPVDYVHPAARDWGKATTAAAAAAAAVISTATPASRSASTTIISGSVPLASSASPPYIHSISRGPIAPAPIPLAQQLPAAPASGPGPAPAPNHHERKSSYNLLASMIPGFSPFGGMPNASSGAMGGAAPAAAGAAFPPTEGLASSSSAAAGAAAHFPSPDPSFLRGFGVEDGGVWTRQVSTSLAASTCSGSCACL